jgi:hypothetical protein
VPSIRTANLKNVLGPISPDSLPCFYSECAAFGRHQRKSRETIRSSGLEFASSKPELESNHARPLLRAGRPQVSFEHVSGAELPPTVKENGGTAPGATTEKGRANLS